MMRLRYVLALAFLLSSPGSAGADDALVMLLAEADATRGERVYRKCRSCHTTEQGGQERLGPNLYGIVGGPVAGSSGFAKYSKALLGLGGEWTVELLDAYLANPRKAVPGTTMVFNGLRKDRDRADVIVFMNSFSDAPLEF